MSFGSERSFRASKALFAISLPENPSAHNISDLYNILKISKWYVQPEILKIKFLNLPI